MNQREGSFHLGWKASEVSSLYLVRFVGLTRALKMKLCKTGRKCNGLEILDGTLDNQT